MDSSELVRLVCDNPTESLVRFVDLDSDEAEEAVVSVVCGEANLTTTGVFVAGEGSPALVDTLTGYKVSVDEGAQPTLTAVARPALIAARTGGGLLPRLALARIVAVTPGRWESVRWP